MDPTDKSADNPWLGGGGKVVIPFSGTIDEFDYVAYANRYMDLREAYGYDKEALYDHYVTCGMNEGRIANAVN